MDLSKLKDPFPAKDIEWRVQRSGVKNGNPWAMVLAYVTNRAIMDRLDEVCGPGKWKNYFETGPNGGVLCGIAIKYDDEWVTKWDGADNTEVTTNKKLDTDTNIKGGLSASMKRAGSQWGIGRYLYNLDTGFASVSDKGRFNGKAKDKDKKDVYFKWDAPSLPKWALPTGEEPAKQPKKETPMAKQKPEKSAIDHCLDKMRSYTDVDTFQEYLDKHWSQVEHAFKDDGESMKIAAKAMTDHFNKLKGEKDD